MARDSCLARVLYMGLMMLLGSSNIETAICILRAVCKMLTGYDVIALGANIGDVSSNMSFINVPGLLKIRYIGQTTLGSATIFGLFLGAGSLIH
uniref:Sodium/calcium exchanger membrane region domain-containing protein n=1 Tax=Solanum lycopersicum TaxID=4081 RepID=A0A3Q7IXY7_SOLLC